MKRPLATVGTVVLVSLAAAFVFGVTVSLVLAVITLVLAAVCFACGRRTAAAFLAVSAVFFTLGALSLKGTEADVNKYAGETLSVTAAVTKTESRNSKQFIYANVKKINSKNVGKDIRIKCYYFENVDVGDEIYIGFRFSEEFYTKDAAGVEFYGEVVKTMEIESHQYRVLWYSNRLKAKIARTIGAVLSGEEGVLASAILTGNKDLISTQMNLEFQRAGVSHILVVSGLHVTFMLSAVYWLFEKARFNRITIFIITVAFAALLAVFYGFTPSVMRACVMAVIVFGGRAFYRKPDSITSLVFAALVIELFDIDALLDPSFLLSFGCCFAIFTVYPFVAKKLLPQKPEGIKKALTKVARPLLLTASVSVTLLPICILFSIPTSLVSPITNLLIVWTVPFELGCSFLLVLSSVITGLSPLTYLLGLVTGVISRYIIFVSEFSAGLGFASVSLHDSYLRLWLLFAVAIVAVYLLMQKRERLRYVVGCICAVLIAGMLSKYIATANKPVIMLYRGNCAVATDNGESALIINEIEADEVEYLVSFLDYRLIDNLKYVIILNNLSDAAELAVTTAFPESEILSAYPVYPQEVASVLKRTAMNVGDFEILTNERLVTKVLYGFTSVEFCAGVPDNTEECEICVYWRNADEDEIIHRGYPIRYSERSCFDESGVEYAYNDTVSVYFNDYLSFKAVIE